MVDRKDLASSVTEEGVFWRNPTHIYEGEQAESQSDIVKEIKGANLSVKKETLRFGEDVRNIILPGFNDVRTMDKESLIVLGRNLMRYRPNIFKVSIVLGPEYPQEEVRRLETREARELVLSEPKDQTYIGERIGALLANQAISIRFEIISGKLGQFATECEAYAVQNNEVYKDDSLFTPVVIVEYYPN